MKLRRRPGAFVAFVDSFTEETFLRFECDAGDHDVISYHLYDRYGCLVADSDGAHGYPGGVEISDRDGEVLLFVPAERDENVLYRLYSVRGALVTCSDGKRTEIFGGLRLEGNRQLPGRPPGSTRPQEQ